MEKYFAIIFGFLLGIGGLYVCFSQLRNFAQLNSWKKNKGKVIERGTVESEIGKVRNVGIKYCPLLKYTYQVDGKDFTNDAIYPKRMMASPSGSFEWAEKEAKIFADEVTIIYNPENPADSFLRFPSKSIYYIVGGISILILLYSIFVLLFGVDNWVGSFK